MFSKVFVTDTANTLEQAQIEKTSNVPDKGDDLKWLEFAAAPKMGHILGLNAPGDALQLVVTLMMRYQGQQEDASYLGKKILLRASIHYKVEIQL